MSLLVSHSIAGTGKPYPPKKDDGWISWAGGECPVESSALVDLMFRNGVVEVGHNASAYHWLNNNLGYDIIAYRLHQPQDANSRANDDRLAQHAAAHAGFASTSRDEETDLNECIGQTPEDTTLLMHFLLDEINDAGVNMRLDDAYELAKHLISVGYRKQ